MFSFIQLSRSAAWAASGVSVALAITGCSGGGSAKSQSRESTGTFSLPLSTITNGTTYQLVNAGIQIFSVSTFFDTFLSSGPDGGTTDLSTSLPTGSYNADLEFGWTLKREDAQGNFEPVAATLTSSSFVPFTIYNGATTTVTFTFQTDGVAVIVGSGIVNVAIDVNAADAACTPLGSDCASGSWCPPASLSGADLACVPAGFVAVGQPCTDPTSCVANASCFQVGDAGTLCAALCPSSGVNLPCASGGTCNPATADYGICVVGDDGVTLGGGTPGQDAGSPFPLSGDRDL
jgi:hypothetical protein